MHAGAQPRTRPEQQHPAAAAVPPYANVYVPAAAAALPLPVSLASDASVALPVGRIDGAWADGSAVRWAKARRVILPPVERCILRIRSKATGSSMRGPTAGKGGRSTLLGVQLISYPWHSLSACGPRPCRTPSSLASRPIRTYGRRVHTASLLGHAVRLDELLPERLRLLVLGAIGMSAGRRMLVGLR